MELELSKLRKEIDETDLKLASLLSKRLDIVKKIKLIKKELNKNIIDPVREDYLQRLLKINNFDNEELLTLFNKIRLFFKEIQRPNKIALIGTNLEHSFSLEVHRIISRLTKLNYKFEYLDITNLDASEVYNLLLTYQYKAFFITMPFKKSLISNRIYLTYYASKLEAINLLYVKNNLLIGDNSDYFGFIKTFDEKQAFLNYKPFILGDGASAIMVYNALIDMGYKHPIMVSLTPNNKDSIDYDMFNLLNPEVVINTTPVGMYPNTNDSLLKENTKLIKYYYDLIYNPKKTKNVSFLPKSAFVKNGIEMLIMQAIKGIELIYDTEISNNLVLKIKKEIMNLYDIKIK